MNYCDPLALHPDWASPAAVDAYHRVSPEALALAMLPPAEQRLRALTYFPPAATRVVILGQDPYPAGREFTVAGQADSRVVIAKANGLAFGINPGWQQMEMYRPHSSFANILGELRGPEGPLGVGTGGWDLPAELWELEHGARQGVLLLNTRLTTAPGQPMSMAGRGWERVVQALLEQVPRDSPVAWLAWGREAADVVERHAGPRHLVVATTHPCRYSATRGTAYLEAFVGSSCFARANDYLYAEGQAQILWGRPRAGVSNV